MGINQVEGTSFRPHTFTLEYPKEAAEAILHNWEYLEKLIPDFGWQIELFAGYNFVPENYGPQDMRQVSDLRGTKWYSSILIARWQGNNMDGNA